MLKKSIVVIALSLNLAACGGGIRLPEGLKVTANRLRLSLLMVPSIKLITASSRTGRPLSVKISNYRIQKRAC